MSSIYGFRSCADQTYASSVYIDEPPAPASGTDRVGKVMGDHRIFNREAPGPSRDVLPVRASRLIALRIVHWRSVDAIRRVPPRRRRPSESVGGGNKTILAGPLGDRSLSQKHQTGRHILHLRRIDGAH